MYLTFDDVRYSPDASSNVNYSFFVPDVKCGLRRIKSTVQSKCYTWTKSRPKMFGNRTEAMLDRRGPGTSPGPVLTLL